MANTKSIDLERDSSQYLNIADTASLSITGDMTLETWVKMESDIAQGTERYFVSKWTSANGLSYLFFYAWYGGQNRKISVGTSANGSAYTINSIDRDISSLGPVWHHLAFVLDVSANSCEIFVDTVSIGTLGIEGSIHDNASHFTIGTHGDLAQYYDGLIDDVRVWNDKRTGAEISANYQKELNGDEAGLVAYWKFNDSLLDETTNDNDLAAPNGSAYSADVPFVEVVDTGNMFLMFP